MTPLRFTVLGSGSVGLAVAASLAQAGQAVTLLARGGAVALLRQQGITVTGVCGDHHIAPQALKVSDVDQPDPADTACDVLVLAGILRARGAEYFFTSPVFVRVLQQTYNLRYLMDKVKEEGL